MSAGLQEAAYELEKAIRQSEEYGIIKQAFTEVKADETAKQLFGHFWQIQMKLQEKQMMGQQISQAEVEQVQQTVSLAQHNDKISRLLLAEQQMGVMMMKLNQMIMKPLDELYATVHE